MKFQRKSFTLLELSIVVGIVVVLAAVAVVTITEWMSKSRDSRRLSDIQQIQKAMDLSLVKNGSYPTPDNYVVGTASGTQAVYKGYFFTGATTKTLLKSIPTDPTTNSPYVYSLNNDSQQYQLSYVLENPSMIVYNNFSDKVSAGSYLAGVVGSYRGVLSYNTGGAYYLANVPSLIFTSNTGADLLNSSTYFVVNKKENLPYSLDGSSMQFKDTATLIKEITGITGAVLTSVNITAYYSGSIPINQIITGNLLTQFGGNTNLVAANSLVGGSIAVALSSQSSGTGCLGSIPTNGIGTATSQNSMSSWAYNTTPGVCSFVCNNGYSWNGSSCQSTPNYFSGAGSSADPYRKLVESASAITVAATSCQYYNLNATGLNDGSSRGTGTCGNGSQACLISGVYLIDPDGSNYTLDSYDKLFINSNTTNGSTTFTDIATSKSITRNGDAINSSTQFIFGGTSMYFDGNGDYLSVPDSTDWDFGNGNFTIEFWINPSTVSNSVNQSIVDKRDGNANVSFAIRQYNQTLNVYIDGFSMSSSNMLSANMRFHVALVRNGNTLTLYLNGVSVASSAFSSTISTSSLPLYIGRYALLSDFYYQGYLQNIRISKGIARRTSNFNPPIPATKVYCDMSNDGGGWNLFMNTQNITLPVTANSVGDSTIITTSATSSRYSDYFIKSMLNSSSIFRVNNKTNGDKEYLKLQDYNEWTSINKIPSGMYAKDTFTGSWSSLYTTYDPNGTCNSQRHVGLSTFGASGLVSGITNVMYFGSCDGGDKPHIRRGSSNISTDWMSVYVK